MPKLEVVGYTLKWHPVDNRGEVRTVFSDGQAVRLPIDTTEEFVAVMMMLSKEPVFFDPDTLFLECPQRPTGT